MVSRPLHYKLSANRKPKSEASKQKLRETLARKRELGIPFGRPRKKETAK